VSKIVQCLKQAQEIYFSEEWTCPPKFDFGRLFISGGLYVYPVQPKSGTSIDSVEFLDMLKAVLASRSKKIYKNDEGEDYLRAVLLIRKKKIYLKILKKIESENHASILQIEISDHGTLRIMLIQDPNLTRGPLKKISEVKSKGI